MSSCRRPVRWSRAAVASRARPVRCGVGVFAIAGARSNDRPPVRDRAHRPSGRRSRGQPLVRRGARCGLARSDRPAHGQAHRPIRAPRRSRRASRTCRRDIASSSPTAAAAASRHTRGRPRPSQHRQSRRRRQPRFDGRADRCLSATVAPWPSSIRKRWRSRDGSNCPDIRRRSSSSLRAAGSSSTCRARGRSRLIDRQKRHDRLDLAGDGRDRKLPDGARRLRQSPLHRHAKAGAASGL